MHGLYVFFSIAHEKLLVVSPFTEQFVISGHEPPHGGRGVPADFLMAADDMAYKPVAFCQVLEHGVFMVGVRFIISAGDVDAGDTKPPSFQRIYIRVHAIRYLIAVFFRIDTFDKLFRA